MFVKWVEGKSVMSGRMFVKFTHNAYKIEIEGPSQRKENAKKTMK